MEDINHFAISKILGSKIKPVDGVGFGNFQLLSTTEAIQESFQESTAENSSASFSFEEDAKVVQAFEAVRAGAAPDELLWNKEFAAAFAEECCSLGLHAPQSYLVRRIIAVRKGKARYKAHGIELSPTTKKEPHPSIVSRYAHIIEFSLVKIRFRHGASIDDILIDPCLGDKFESMANQIEPGISSKDLRLGALYIRKTRGIKKDDFDKIKNLNTSDLERAWEVTSNLAEINSDAVPSSPGLIELKEARRSLYVAHNDNIHDAISQLHEGEAFRLVASHFWKPRLEEITVSFASGKRIGQASIERWEQKLIYERNPVFNWPMGKRSA